MINSEQIVSAGYTAAQIEEAVRGGYDAFLEEAAAELDVSVEEIRQWAATRAA